ncbi:ATP-dependent DNA helicase RecG [candidate division GN15 bacterium]|nr:ATP-dependent DNA helicase RecG [candidate division GN15 bacterium]
MAELRLDSPLQYVKGVGPRKGAVLAEHELITVRDLLYYFPRQYLDRTSITPIGEVKPDRIVTVIGQIKAHGVLHGRRRRYEAILQDDTGAISLLWFGGLKYWEKLFKKGQVYAATGIVGYFQGYQIVHPELERLEDESDKLVHAGRIIPVYPQTAALSKVGLNSRGLRKVTTFVVENLSDRVADPVPDAEREKAGLGHMHQALVRIHYPENREDIEQARRRLAYDELLAYQFVVVQSKSEREQITKAHRYEMPGRTVTQLKESLPFTLTEAQSRTVDEITGDLRRERPMNRLLQGDVGCGKTVVAVLASAFVAENGMQTAFMAPTEILAEQHYRNWEVPLAEVGIRAGLVTSSLTAAKKRKIAEACAAGEIDVLFGTHALVYDYVQFAKLGLVIIDEQHRFGVRQRSGLHAKGENPDLLVMTATPIPRTLALTLYGDLEISTIESLPPGRQPVRTVWRKADVREKVYQWVRDEVGKGGQAYIVFPLIEKSERSELLSVEDAYKEAIAGVFAGLPVGMVHGRVKPAERDELLAQFREGRLSVLMATTVIEVGLDNPNATLMVIEHAERFGLAQLHQLRGRIGRGEKQSTLVALAHRPISEIAHKRLEYFVSTTDGFKIAEADLELRGPGELYGLRQSGMPAFRMTHLGADRDLITASRDLLVRLFEEHNKLDVEYRRLYTFLQQKTADRPSETRGG